MSTQVTLRLPDELVSYLDERTRAGAAHSRAETVIRALVEQQRREADAADAAIYDAMSDEHEWDGLVDYSRRHPPAID